MMARKGTMKDYQINSKFLHETIQIKVYEPEEFDPLYENNLCIMQDGDDYFHLGRVATVSDRLHDDFEIVNTTFVGIPYIDRYDRWKKYHPDGEQFTAYKMFLKEEVVPLLDEILPINPLGTIRTLLGDSLAGTISLLAALDAPHLFSNIIMQSPYVDHYVLEAARKFNKSPMPEIYHTVGLAEHDVPTTKLGKLDFVAPNKELREVLARKFPVYHYEENPDGNHTWKFWQKELPDIFINVFI